MSSDRPSRRPFTGAVALALPLSLLLSAALSTAELTDAVPAPILAADGRFARSVALDGARAILGEPGASYARRNLAHVFTRAPDGSWSLEQTLDAVGSGLGEVGAAVDLADPVAVVGAPLSDPSKRGAVVLFERNVGRSLPWSEVLRLTPGSGGSNRDFGRSVAVLGERVLVGAPGRDGGSLLPTVLGAAFVYERDYGPVLWGEVVELAPDFPPDAHGFGASVALWGNLAIVGSPFENDGRGAVYLFARNRGGPDGWDQLERLTLEDATPGELYGLAVTATGLLAPPTTRGTDTVWVAAGAPRRGSAGVVAIHSSTNSGPWTLAQELSGADPDPSVFGGAVALDGPLLVVGNPNGPSVVARGGTPTGVVTVHRLGGSTWTRAARFVTAGDEPQGLGGAVAASDGRVLLGAPYRDWDAVSDPGAFYELEAPLFADGFESGGTPPGSSQAEVPPALERWSARSAGAPWREVGRHDRLAVARDGPCTSPANRGTIPRCPTSATNSSTTSGSDSSARATTRNWCSSRGPGAHRWRPAARPSAGSPAWTPSSYRPCRT